MTSFVIPYPPSVNGLFATIGRKRVKSRAYKDWIEAAGWEIRAQSVPLHRGKVEVEYEVGRPDRRRRDLGNTEKSVSDLLVSCGVIEDDSLIERIVLEWADVEGVRVTVRAV